MATDASLWALLLLLAASLQAVSSANQCYQSSCLPHDLLGCYSDQRVSLKTCSYDDFVITAQGLSTSFEPEAQENSSMVCVSFEATGELDHRVHGVVIKMCYPNGPKPCHSLEQYVRHHMSEYGIQNKSLSFTCSSCDVEGCNSSVRPASATSALLAAVLAIAARNFSLSARVE